MINTETMHPGFKDHLFRYLTGMIVNEDGTSWEMRHRIQTKERGRGKRWTYLGDNNGPLDYSTEAAAREDVEKLQQWAAS
ncbi:MAG: hypothetical protein OEV64_02315 [Desulfobulbaceae bacterium]|nr:hypothetical protein [Desulfobulbaceae bacterium]